MDSSTDLVRVVGSWDGIVGFHDVVNPTYMIQARLSFRGNTEENRRLEEEIYSVYLGYLQRVAMNNNGFY